MATEGSLCLACLCSHWNALCSLLICMLWLASPPDCSLSSSDPVPQGLCCHSQVLTLDSQPRTDP